MLCFSWGSHLCAGFRHAAPPVLEAEGNRGDMLGPLDHAGHSGQTEEAGGSQEDDSLAGEKTRPVWVGSSVLRGLN